MELYETPILNPSVVLREEFDEWAVLFHPDTAAAVGINPVGVAVWKLIDGRRTLADISREITRLFSGVPDTAEEEIRSFIEKLVEKGFVGIEQKGGPVGTAE